MSKLISIVIPCYNVEPYIDRCLTSLVNQTIGVKKLEIILVDDASKDRTWDKLVEWEGKYPESIIIIQHEKNKKQGAARNTGLQYASAPYIGFVDSDDWSDLTMFEKLYQALILYQTDVSGCLSYRAVNEAEKGSILDAEPLLRHYDTEEEKKILMKKGFWGGVYCWIYRRELIFENHILFPEFITYEDNYWKDILKLYLHSSVLLQEELYYYYVNTNSTIMNRNCMALMDRLSIEERKLMTYRELGVFESYYQEVEYNFVLLFFINTIYIILSRCNNFSLPLFNYMKKKLVELFPDYKDNEYLKKELLPLEQSILELADKQYMQDELNQMVINFRNEMRNTTHKVDISRKIK